MAAARGERLVSKVPVAGGEVCVVAPNGYSTRFDVSLDGRRYSLLYEPRETGSVALFEDQEWSDPPGPIAEEDLPRLLDALWVAMQKSVRALLVWDAAARCYVAARWNLDPNGFLARITECEVDYLELGRTLRIPSKARAGTVPRQAHLDASGARWVHPPAATERDAALESAEWVEIRRRLVNCTREDCFLTGLTWQVESQTAPS